MHPPYTVPIAAHKNRRNVGWSLSVLCCCQRKEPQQKDEVPSTPGGVLLDMEEPSSSRNIPPGGLPDDVFRTIRAVDQQTSTLTQAGVLGLSARVLDKSEFRNPQTNEVFVVQLVEIIKKPGQSLGLYLREGNGYDRPAGVFASRFGENSELEKYGEMIRPGDEILSINNVEVSAMSIDDVVLILSIPRRLLLRIRFSKNRRERSSAGKPSSDRPVVVFHKIEERPPGEPSPSSLLSQPTSTADTWLGKRARQQSQEMQLGGSSTLSRPSNYSNPHGPRLLNGHGEPLPREAHLRDTRDTVGTMKRYSDPDPLDTVSRTARVPPPKIYSTSMRRADSFNQQPQSSNIFSLPRSSTTVPPPESMMIGREPLSAREPLTRSLCSPVMPRSLRQQQQQISDHKSNSLPRRRAISGPRNVKWRTDVVANDLLGEDSDGATSAPEYGGIGSYGRPNYATMRNVSNGGTMGRTVNDIFSAAEYRNWAGPGQMGLPGMGVMAGGAQVYPGQNITSHHIQLSTPGYALTEQQMGRQSRWSQPGVMDNRGGTRSCSLPGRSLVTQSLVGSPQPLRRENNVLDRYHVSPLMNRRAPLRTAGPGINVDRLNVNSLTGILFVQILEGRGLKIPEKQKAVTEEMYCVLEVDECHRARTGVSTSEQRYRWRETFHIDVVNATTTHFFVYSWHPQFRHKLCHKGSLKLLEAFVVDQLNGDRIFALSLEPRGQLIVRIGFHDMDTVFRRQVNSRSDAVFGVPLARLLQRERRETPTVLTRLIHELERRGVDYNGLYILCGSVEKKRVLRDELECKPNETDLALDSVPDTNVLACLIKDFLRELPEPLVPLQIHGMLLDAAAVVLPNDLQGNRQLILRIVDCLPTPNKNTFLMVLDHLLLVLSSSPHNGLSPSRLAGVFAPLLFCTTDQPPIQSQYSTPHGYSTSRKETVRPLDVSQAISTLQLLFEVWPTRVNGSSESSSTSSHGPQGAYATRPQPQR